MKKLTSFRTVALCCIFTTFSSCADMGMVLGTPPSASGRVITSAPGNSGNTPAAARGAISAAQARQLAAANGLTGRRSLPPGIARNLARGKPLPPGIARQMVPQGMLSGLPSIAGHEWRIAGQDLILVLIATAVVVEILSEVFE
ncbi:MAG: anti-virulence regulator CigR family protein [Pseudomonadota bacterium]